MTLREPFPLENIGAVYNARDYRALLKRLFGDRPGIFGAGHLAVSQQAVPAMGVTVAAGGGLVDAAGAGIDGLYFVDNDAAVNVALAAADAVNPRRDIIGIRVRDSESAGADNDGAIVAVTGVPAAVPVDPALPTNFLPLARVAVAALAANIVNANITDLRRSTASQGGLVTAAGGTIIANTYAQLPTVGIEVGQRGYAIDFGVAWIWSGAAWLAEAVAVPHEATAIVTSAAAATTSAVFVNLGVRCRVVGFVKRLAATNLTVLYAGAILNDNNLGEYEVAVLVNGVDNVVGHDFGSGQKAGALTIAGLAAGNYDVEVRKRRVNGVGNVTDGNIGGRNTVLVRETF